MLSARLVRVIGSHCDEIASRVLEEVRKNPGTPNLGRRPDGELLEWNLEILENLGYLLSAPKDDDIWRRLNALGKLRFEEGIPLHEAILRLQILRRKIIGFVREQGFSMTVLQLYAEEDLHERLDHCFDAMTYHLVRGYEKAQSVAWRVA